MERYFAWKFYFEFVAPFIVIGVVVACFLVFFAVGEIKTWREKRNG